MAFPKIASWDIAPANLLRFTALFCRIPRGHLVTLPGVSKLQPLVRIARRSEIKLLKCRVDDGGRQSSFYSMRIRHRHSSKRDRLHFTGSADGGIQLPSMICQPGR